MAKAIINERAIAKLVSKSPMLHRAMERTAKQRFSSEKQKMISDFNNHPVTQEIAAGRDSGNISNTLPSGYGNLFTFIGVNEGSDPTGSIGLILETGTKFQKMNHVKIQGNRITVDFSFSLPQEDMLKNASRTPWSGRSWLYSIETGISGFGNYMYGVMNKSRSGKAIQAKHGIRGGAFRPTAYIRKIFSDFTKRLSS